MSLPIAWIEDVFAKLALTYGRDFVAQYEGLDLALVKANWAQELAGFDPHPQALALALHHLPADRPPNVLQFRALCRRMPLPPPQALAKPDSDPAIKAAGLAAIAQFLAELKGRQ